MMVQNKISKNILTMFLIFLSVFIIFSIKESVYAKEYVNEKTNYVAYIKDDANLLTEEEKNKLLEKMKKLTEYGGVLFITTENNNLYVDEFAKNKTYEYFKGKSGVTFLIDMNNRKIYIYSTGEIEKKIGRDNALTITDNVYKYAKKGEYYETASKAFLQIEKVVRGEKILAPMKYITATLLSVTLAFLIMYIYVKNSRKIVEKKNASVLGTSLINVGIHGTNIAFLNRKSYPIKTNTPTYVGGFGGFGGGSGSRGGGSGGGHSF